MIAFQMGCTWKILISKFCNRSQVGIWSKANGTNLDVSKVVFMGHNLNPSTLSSGLKGVVFSIITTIVSIQCVIEYDQLCIA